MPQACNFSINDKLACSIVLGYRLDNENCHRWEKKRDSVDLVLVAWAAQLGRQPSTHARENTHTGSCFSQIRTESQEREDQDLKINSGTNISATLDNWYLLPIWTLLSGQTRVREQSKFQWTSRCYKGHANGLAIRYGYLLGLPVKTCSGIPRDVGRERTTQNMAA